MQIGDLGLRCFPMSNKMEARLIWVKAASCHLASQCNQKCLGGISKIINAKFNGEP